MAIFQTFFFNIKILIENIYIKGSKCDSKVGIICSYKNHFGEELGRVAHRIRTAMLISDDYE
jgi:hypothetical protein